MNWETRNEKQPRTKTEITIANSYQIVKLNKMVLIYLQAI